MDEHQIVRDFEFHAGGRAWIVPEFRLDKMPDGSLGASMVEFSRVHQSIVNAICGCPGPLTQAEFEFVCDVCDVPYAKVAKLLGLDRSSLTKWMKTTRPMRIGRSNLLKQWFLLQLFGDRIGRKPIRAGALADAKQVLAELHDEVIRSGAAAPIGAAGVSLKMPSRYLPPMRSAVSPSTVAFELAPARHRRRESHI